MDKKNNLTDEKDLQTEDENNLPDEEEIILDDESDLPDEIEIIMGDEYDLPDEEEILEDKREIPNCEDLRIIELLDWDFRFQDALRLIAEVFDEFEAPGFSKEGVQEFHDFLYSDEITNKMKNQEYFMWGCYDDDRIVGTISLRDPCHIPLLFVDKDCHRKGIAKKLFHTVLDYAKENTCFSVITVNSSPYAVEVYKRFGFEETDEEQELNGVRFTPMQHVFRDLSISEENFEQIIENLDLIAELGMNGCIDHIDRMINDSESKIVRRGKNWFVTSSSYKITIDSEKYEVTDAKKVKSLFKRKS